MEKDCQRNLEAVWLVKGLRPGYRTIADFRKRNPKALRQVHAGFIGLCKELDLPGGERVGVDGTATSAAFVATRGRFEVPPGC